MWILSKITKPSLKTQFSLLAIFGSLLPLAVVTLLIHLFYSHFHRDLTRDIKDLNSKQMKQIVAEGMAILQTGKDFLEEKLRDNLKVANEIIERDGHFVIHQEKVKWVAVNRDTGKAFSVELPKLFISKTWLGQNTDPAQETPFVDSLGKLLNCICTVYQRMNEQGDMLIVATNQIIHTGNRSTGEFISSRHPNGKQNGLISAILEGKDFLVRDHQDGEWFLGNFEPIFDSKDEVIGMFSVSIKQTPPPTLQTAFSAIDLGPGGNVFVLGTNGREQGVFLASKVKELIGQNLWDLQELNGEYPIRNMINAGLALQKNEIAFLSYKDPKSDDSERSGRFLALGYWKPWGWIVGVEMSSSDFYASQQNLTYDLKNLLTWSLLGGLLIAIATFVLAFFIIRRLAKPIVILKTIAQHIAQGDLIKAKKIADDIVIKDEPSFEQDFKDHFILGKESSFDAATEAETFLITAKKLALNLYTLVSGVQHSGLQVTTSSTQIAVSSRELSSTASQQAASAAEVGVTSRQISNTAHALVQTMNHLIEVASEAASFAQDGKDNLNKMEQTVRQFINAASSISSKLSIIRDRAKDINSIVFTINSVADQTNLISLNAAIEAERAGEYGFGFAVVAREIRRLADQTATATLNIEHIIEGMNSAIFTGILEAEKFGKDIDHGVVHLNEVNAKLEKVIAHVEILPNRFETVNEHVKNQSISAQQISESMTQLEQATREIYDALREFNNATEQLNDTALVLEQEVDRFKIRDRDLTLQNL